MVSKDNFSVNESKGFEVQDYELAFIELKKDLMHTKYLYSEQKGKYDSMINKIK